MVFRPGQERGRGAQHGALCGPFRPAKAGEYHGFIVADFGANSNRRGRGSGNGGGPGKTGESAALPHRAEAEPGSPHVVRIRTDTFLCPEKCPRCRVRWGWTGRSILFKAALSFTRAALWYGQFCAGWPRPCPPPHAAFRTRCTRTVQRVRSEAHYAAAVPRLARPASGGGPGKAGKSAALICWVSHCPGAARAKKVPPRVCGPRGGG